MKKIVLIALFIGTYFLAPAQTAVQSDELSNLKKQVSSLKQKNLMLDQNLKELKKASKIVFDSLKIYDSKLTALTDSFNAKKSVILTLKRDTNTALKSLSHRKSIFYTFFFIVLICAIVVLVLAYLFITKQYKTVNEKIEMRVSSLKDGLESEINKTKNDLQAQIKSVNDELDKKGKELDQKIKELKK
jgi:hypothetical protein